MAAGEGHGDHGPLAHPAEELVRVGRSWRRGSGIPTRARRSAARSRASRGRSPRWTTSGFPHLVADRQVGVEARHGVLEDQSRSCSPADAAAPPAPPGEVAPLELDRLGRHRGGRPREEPEDGEGHGRLPRFRSPRRPPPAPPARRRGPRRPRPSPDRRASRSGPGGPAPARGALEELRGDGQRTTPARSASFRQPPTAAIPLDGLAGCQPLAGDTALDGRLPGKAELLDKKLAKAFPIDQVKWGFFLWRSPPQSHHE